MDEQKIIRKIQGLLAIARDEKNDKESQSAFLLAQKLMVQYGLEEQQVTDESAESKKSAITELAVTAYKRLFWWERYLAQIISTNFRVKYFLNSKVIGRQQKRQIVFYGQVSDLGLAKSMYLLGYEVLLFHSQNFVEQYYREQPQLLRTRSVTEKIKTSYLRGFLAGLEEGFQEQVDQLEKEYALLVCVPAVVEQAYADFSRQWGKALTMPSPNVYVAQAYQNGYEEGKNTDLTKQAIKDDSDV